MQNNLELKTYFQEYLVNESKAIFDLLSVSEQLEREGLKNIARYIRALSYSRQAIISRFYRNLKLIDDPVRILEELKELETHKIEKLENIELEAERQNNQGCLQTIYFVRESLKIEQIERNRVIEQLKKGIDVAYKQIVVCPLCSLVIVDEVERCPLCGANKAIFKAF
ncbi:MAG: hypothetical protein N2202_07635 [Proteobacteria bacterium]|nr:hypothetical protein [Pseudomonadota bacterium]